MKGADLTKLFIGGFLILLGVGFLADQFFGINFGSIIGAAWPVLIMLSGLYIMLRARSQMLFGLIIFIVGGALLIDQLFDLPFSIWNLWPLIFVVIGLRIIFGDIFKINTSVVKEDKFDSTAVFWGDSRKIKSNNLKFGKVTALFGGSDIDLSEAEISKDGADIDCVAIFGGVTIKVSKDINVDSEGIGLFGGFDDKTGKSDDSKAIIRIKGFALFGGVEVKN